MDATFIRRESAGLLRMIAQSQSAKSSQSVLSKRHPRGTKHLLRMRFDDTVAVRRPSLRCRSRLIQTSFSHARRPQYATQGAIHAEARINCEVKVLSKVNRDDVLAHSIMVLVGSTLLNVGSFAFHAIVGRRIGVAAYGSLYALVSFVLLASFPAGICNTVLAKFCAELKATENEAAVRALVVFVGKAFGGLTLAYGIFGVIGAYWIGGFLGVAPWTIGILAFLAGAVIFVFALRGITQGMQDFAGFSTSLVMDGALKGTVGAMIASAKLGQMLGVFGFFFGTLCSGIFVWWRLWSRCAEGAKVRLEVNVPRLFSTGFGAATLTVATAILSYADVLLVKHFFPAHDAGIYAAASLAAKILFFLVSFAPLVLIPKAVQRHALAENPLPVLAVAFSAVIVLSAAGLLAFRLAGTFIVEILVGPAFSSAALLLPWYGLAMVLLALTNVVASYSIALHKFGFGLPVILCAGLEVAAIVLFHAALPTVVMVLVTGNAAALVVTAVALLVQSLPPGPAAANIVTEKVRHTHP